MDRKAFLQGLTVSAILLTSAARLHAQTAPSPTLTLRVPGLTAQERDALTQDLGNGTGLELAFACVPAGLLVIVPTDPASGIDPRTAAAPSIGRTLTLGRATEVTLTLQQAEADCANARNQ